MSRHSARLRAWILAALCAGLAAVIALEFERGASLARPASALAEPSASASSAKPQALPSQTFALAPMQSFSAVVERTLFDASRRPAPEEPDEAPAAAAAELRELVLTGVVITPAIKVAFFRDKTPSQVIRLEPGGAFGKWLLDEVRDDGVTLRRGMVRREMRLHEVEDPARLKGVAKAALAKPDEASAPPAEQATAPQPKQALVPQVRQRISEPAVAEQTEPKVRRPKRGLRRFVGRTAGAARGEPAGGE